METYLGFMKNRLKDFSESNVMLNKEFNNVLLKLTKESTFNRGCYQVVVLYVSNKLSDAKFVESNYQIME